MLEFLADVMIVVAFVPVTALLLIYGLLQPWWRSKFGWAMILTLFALWQTTLRALVILWFGEEYAGRPWILLAGRTELAVGATIGAVGLGRELFKSWRARTLPEMPPWDHRGSPSRSNKDSVDPRST